MSEAPEADPRQQIIDARKRSLAGCSNARHAIDLLDDTNSFTEFGLLACHTTAVDEDGPCDGVVCGICDIDCNPALIAAPDRSV
ncbi:MAG: hypothetical protein VX410_06945, partial [Actinomycetota bacterium]|nr:hypothetical protein [Actinomycetota bacterium]